MNINFQKLEKRCEGVSVSTKHFGNILVDVMCVSGVADMSRFFRKPPAEISAFSDISWSLRNFHRVHE